MPRHLRVGSAIAATIFAGGLAGLLGRGLLPPEHLTRETLDFVRAATGVVSVLTSLVLGLLIFSAKGSLDALDRDLRRLAGSLSHLDLVLRHYGPDAEPARAAVRAFAERLLEDAWPREDGRKPTIEGATAAMLMERVPLLLFGLTPEDEAHRFLHARALVLVSDLMETRWLLIEDAVNAIQPPFLVILVAWLTIIFAGFGLNATINATVLVVLLVSSISVAAALILVIDLVNPFEGIITLSSAPLRKALTYLGH